MIDSFLPKGWIVGDVYKVRLPTNINVSKKVTKALNLNVYRNLHHYSLNTQKQNFHDQVKPLLKDIPKAEKIWIHYTVYAARNGRLDTMNVGSIVDKYFSDTLVEAKKIMDDHFDHVVLVSFSFGGVRSMDGHTIATIHILEEESPMRILLDQNDIQTALDTYVTTMGFSGASGVVLSVNDNGSIEAEVMMGEVVTTVTATKTTKPKRGRPRKAKPEVTEEVVEDESTGTTGEGSSNSTDTGSTEQAESDPKEGETEPTKTKKGNLFGDEEKQSSESPETKTTEGSDEEKTPATKTVMAKKSSIFDVD